MYFESGRKFSFLSFKISFNNALFSFFCDTFLSFIRKKRKKSIKEKYSNNKFIYFLYVHFFYFNTARKSYAFDLACLYSKRYSIVLNRVLEQKRKKRTKERQNFLTASLNENFVRKYIESVISHSGRAAHRLRGTNKELVKSTVGWAFSPTKCFKTHLCTAHGRFVRSAEKKSDKFCTAFNAQFLIQ